MPKTALQNIRIVLVEPAGALNVGSIARVMKNMGLSRLVLVKPHCDHLGDEARQMAVHARNVLEAASIVESLPVGLTGCQWTIATTARSRTLPMPLEPPKVILPWLLKVAAQGEVALIFGPEDRGLNNTELNYAQRCLGIPSSQEYPSLNLAQAVAVCCYELFQLALEDSDRTEKRPEHGDAISASNSVVDGSEIQSDSVSAPSHSQPTVSDATELPASFEKLEAYHQQLETLLLKIGYLYPHTAASRMKKLRRLYSRALPSDSEVAMLRGILSQMEWALQNSDKFPNG